MRLTCALGLVALAIAVTPPAAHEGHPGRAQVTNLDPSAQRLPARFQVTDMPDIVLTGEAVSLESIVRYTTSGALTIHEFPVVSPPGAGGTVELIADGDYESPGETATAGMEGVLLGIIGEAGDDCGAVAGAFAVSLDDLTSAAADGVVQVAVRNSDFVQTLPCTANTHTVRLSYTGPADRIDFGTVFLELSRSHTLTISNHGSDLLIVDSITSDRSEFAVSPPATTLAPGVSTDVIVTFAPTSTAALSGTLTITSNDPDMHSVEIDLSGSGLEPPIADVDPTSLNSTLLWDVQETQLLTLSNLGGSPLEFSVSVFPRATGAMAVGSLKDPVTLAPGDVELLPPSPLPLTSVVADPRSGILYGQAYRGTALFRYVAAGDRWEFLSYAPIRADDAGGAALLNGKIYIAYADGPIMSVYDIATDTWSTQRHPLDAGTANITSDGDRFLYLIVGNGLIQLDPETEEWATLSPPPLDFGRKGGLEHLAGVLHVHRTREFASYDIASDTWTLLPRLPWPGGAVGAAIDPVGRGYFVNGSLQRLFRYDLDTGIWTESIVPFWEGVGLGGMGWLPGAVPAVYFVQGVDGTGFARLATEPGFLSVRPSRGTIAPLDSLDLEVTFDSTDLPAGDFEIDIGIGSNDPFAPLVMVPAVLTVPPVSDISVSRGVATIESVKHYSILSASTQHDLVVGMPPVDEARIELVAEGDFRGIGNRATATAEGMHLGSVGGPRIETPCPRVSRSFPIGSADLAALVADGFVHVEVENSPGVRTGCPVNRHTVRFLYDAPPGQLAFEPTFIGFGRSLSFTIENRGTGTLEVTMSSDRPEFSLSDDSLNIPPRSSATVTATFDPAMTDAVVGTLTITSNDPDTPIVEIPLSGTGLVPPVMTVEPPSLESFLFEGNRETRLLPVANTGSSTLLFQAAVNTPDSAGFVMMPPVSGSVEPGEAVGLEVLFDTFELPPGLYEASIEIASSDPATPRLTVPVSLTVLGGPGIAAGSLLVSSHDFEGQDAETIHDLHAALPPPAGGGGRLALLAEGNYRSPSSRATATLEDVVTLSSVGGTGEFCVPAEGSFRIGAGDLATVAADGIVRVSVKNTRVGSPCPVNRHTVALFYELEQIDFGSVGVGGSSSLSLTLLNDGSEPLVVGSIMSDLDEVTASPASVTIPPESSADLTITFSPATLSGFEGTLRIASNDPETPLLEIALGGAGGTPPQAAPHPLSFEVALPPGGATTRLLHLTNTGGDELSWALSLVQAVPPPPGWLDAGVPSGVLAPGNTAGITLGFDTTGLPDGDHMASLIIDSNDPDDPEIVVPVVLHLGQVALDIIDVKPSTLNLASRGKTVSGRLQLPPTYDPRDVLIETVSINGQVFANPSSVAFRDDTKDGVDELIVTFDREALAALLPTSDNVPVTITGEVKDTIWFTGTDIIRTLTPNKGK